MTRASWWGGYKWYLSAAIRSRIRVTQASIENGGASSQSDANQVPLKVASGADRSPAFPLREPNASTLRLVLSLM
jgi:hypothetical protein